MEKIIYILNDKASKEVKRDRKTTICQNLKNFLIRIYFVFNKGILFTSVIKKLVMHSVLRYTPNSKTLTVLNPFHCKKYLQTMNEGKVCILASEVGDAHFCVFSLQKKRNYFESVATKKKVFVFIVDFCQWFWYY